jgi:hypothetical protein
VERVPQGEQVNVIWYSGFPGLGCAACEEGVETRSVRGFWEAVGCGEGSEAVGSDEDSVVVELKRRKDDESGCIRGKGLCVGRARSDREFRGALGAYRESVRRAMKGIDDGGIVDLVLCTERKERGEF